MTKFIDGSKRNEPKKERKETVFTHFVNAKKEIKDAKVQPEKYDNVEFLFHDKDYGDVFKVWDNDNQSDYRMLFFGAKGDEDYG